MEIEEYIKSTRKKAYQALFKDISEERVSKLRTFFGAANFDGYLMGVQLPKLALDFNYDPKRANKLRKEVRGTDINEIHDIK